MNNLDPQWAWSQFIPKSGEWTAKLAAHLYRRAGFAANAETLKTAAKRTPSEVVHDLVHGRTESNDYRQEINALLSSIIATGDVKNLPAWWTYRFLTTPDVLQEKTTLFWHGHFATSGAKVDEPELMIQQNEILRENALGDFGEMVHEISRDPAMLIYLDSATNRKAHPNENFAREVMELFCLGEGQYTEEDIRELSRCFTGWEVRNGKFRFNRYQHDSGSKSFLGSTGKFGGEEGVDVVLKQRSAPYFVVSKLVRYFVADEPEPTSQLIEPLAHEFAENGLQIGPIIAKILISNLFYSEHAIARKVRSPIEFAVGFLRALDGSTDLYALTQGLTQLGQTPFFPPNVKGWDGGRTWINSSTLLARANLIQQIISNKKTRFGQKSFSDYCDSQRWNSGDEIVDGLSERLLAVEVPLDVHRHLVNQIESKSGKREQRLREMLHLFCTLPEFQLA